jgi:phosphoglucosamine mutase
MGLEIALRKRNQAFLGTDVGDRHVSQGLRDTGYPYGGEPSGHIIIPEILATGDGMLAAIQSLSRLDASPFSSLAEWYDEIPLLEQHVVNVPTENRDRIGSPAFQGFYNAQIAALDAEYGGKFSLNIRASGTQQAVRVMFEGDNAQRQAQIVAERLAPLLNS